MIIYFCVGKFLGLYRFGLLEGWSGREGSCRIISLLPFFGVVHLEHTFNFHTQLTVFLIKHNPPPVGVAGVIDVFNNVGGGDDYCSLTLSAIFFIIIIYFFF